MTVKGTSPPQIILAQNFHFKNVFHVILRNFDFLTSPPPNPHPKPQFRTGHISGCGFGVYSLPPIIFHEEVTKVWVSKNEMVSNVVIYTAEVF